MIKYSFLLIALYTTALSAQTTQPAVALSHYVLDSFANGRVLLKSGAVSEQLLNYNILTGEMIFDAGGKYLAIAEPQNVDTVFIGARQFVPVEKGFYEVLTHTAAPLFIKYTCTVQEPGSSIGYGVTSNTTASPALKTLIGSGGAYELKLPDDFKVSASYTYLVFKDGAYQKAMTAQQLAKVFPEKKNLLSDLIKQNHTDFSKREDVAMLVQQLEQ